jgi:hypothetical protein
VGLSGGSHLSEKNDHMDDTSRDLSSPLSLLAITHITWMPRILLVGQMELFRDSVATSSDWWSPLLPFFPFLMIYY